jgi:hypothetical protein
MPISFIVLTVVKTNEILVHTQQDAVYKVYESEFGNNMEGIDCAHTRYQPGNLMEDLRETTKTLGRMS